jgi:hypothetical protein
MEEMAIGFQQEGYEVMLAAALCALEHAIR